MCKALKDGGTRCAYHLGENASAALVTYVATTTGLGGEKTREALVDLTAEFAGAPEPSREQVDDFLEQQAFRVRHEPGLTEKRRESIVRRLQAAVGRITPDGATFKAWKNLVAEAWTRVRRKAAAAFVVGALTFSLGACGTPGSTESADPGRVEQVATAPANPTESASPAEAEVPWKVKKVQIKPAAVDLYGQKAVEEGRDMAIGFAKDYGFHEDAFNHVAGEDIPQAKKRMLGARSQMTPDAAKDWTGSVNEFFNKKQWKSRDGQFDDVMSWTSYGLHTSDMMPDPEVSLIEKPTVTKLVVDEEINGDRLWVQMETTAHVNYVDKGTLKQAPAERHQDFWFKRIGNKWLLDGWNGSTQIG